MDEKIFSYKDDYPCIYEGMKIFLTKYSVRRKKNYIICFVVSAFLSFLVNISEMINSYDNFYRGFLLLCSVFIGLGSFMYFHLYGAIHLRQKASRMYAIHKDRHKEIILRQDDVIFKRDFCSSNYYYDEFVAVIEGKKSVSFIVSKSAEPIIFSKTSDNAELLTAIVKEKLGERYIDKTKGGRKK